MHSSLARDVQGPTLPLTIDEALADCIVELVEDERGVVGIWQAHPVSELARDGTMQMLGFLRRRDGRAALIEHKFDDDGDITAQARSLVAEAMASDVDPVRSTECPGLVHQLLRLGIVKHLSGRPGDCAISMAQYVRRRTGVDLTTAHRLVHGHLAHQIEAMSATLDAEALAFAAAHEQTLFWIGEREWEGMDGSFMPGAPFRKALAAFPGFSAIFMSLWKDDRSAFGDDPTRSLQAALTASMPGHMAAYRSLSRSIAKHADAIAAAGGASRGANRLLDLNPFFRTPSTSVELRAAATLTKLPSDWVPCSAAEWEALLSVSDSMGTLRQIVGTGPTQTGWEAMVSASDPVASFRRMAYPGPSLTRLFPSGGRWSVFRSRLLKAAAVEDADALRAATNDIGDYRDAFGREILGPAYALTDLDPSKWEYATPRGLMDRSAQTSRAAGIILLSGKSFARILEDSREWHHRQHGIADQLSSITPGFLPMTRWVAGLPDWRCDGYDLKVLTCARELKDEGRRGADADGLDGLSHCVGGYSQHCKANHSRIISLRRLGSSGLIERVSTVEIAVEHAASGSAPRFTIKQHRGYRNADPPACALTVINAYLSAIDRGMIAIDHSQLLPTKNVGTIAQTAGYEFWRPGAFAAAVAAWSPFLPKSMRTWSAADFAALSQPT
ncbi:hypothetical protein [Bosea sp. RAC05]|uniref:hypothetical protein n=1 Tax=Bosea sp. RAC05 TaxID=1842539 RepID=UPI000858694C|nr:hypothetical protein [Bosea sp. RAC05]AOG02889.1 hypothetical protein BSY19_5365 [Bosea sp. RAC05]